MAFDGLVDTDPDRSSSKFGVVEGTTLTCKLHGWQWNLQNGRCLTAKGHELRCGQP
jgi:UDP-MurNAc hydroxylase